jgi:hypothetical protein
VGHLPADRPVPYPRDFPYPRDLTCPLATRDVLWPREFLECASRRRQSPEISGFSAKSLLSRLSDLLSAGRDNHSDDYQPGDHETNAGADPKRVEHGEQQDKEQRTAP